MDDGHVSLLSCNDWMHWQNAVFQLYDNSALSAGAAERTEKFV